MALHANADDTDLGDLGVRDQPVIADLFPLVLQHVGCTGEVCLRHGEGDVGLALVATDVLDDHVDIDIGFGQRTKDVCNRARTVGDAGQGDLGLILVGGDTGDQLAFHVGFLQFFVGHDQCTGDAVGVGCVFVDEGTEHLHAHAFFHRKPDRPCLQYFRTHRGEFEHFFVSDRFQLARAGDDPRIGGINAVNVGIDVAAVGFDRRSNCNRRSIRSAAPQRGYAIVICQSLKTGDDSNCPLCHRSD